MDSRLWQAALGEIELTVTRGSFHTWFKNTVVLDTNNNELVVGVPNIFIKQQLERKYLSLIKDTLKNVGATPKNITFKINTSAKSPQSNNGDEPVFLNNTPQNNQTKAKHNIAKVTHSYRQGLNDKYTFENFIVGSGNELAYAACQAIAQNPGDKYNPLFIYGGVGIGKTHLIQAVGIKILKRDKNARVVYVSSEQFVQEFLDAIRYKKNTDFASYYRGADVLIIDDMQFIAGKEKTQEEFFHTFNALHQANKQLIISSDKPPKDIPTLTDRLRSRFEWGMTVDMQTPDFETRCAIVQIKSSVHGVVLRPDVVEFLANLIQTNIRELEGVLNQLLAFCEIRDIEPDIETATSLLGDIKQRPKHISAKQIIERTAKYFHIQIEEILGPKRDKDIVVPRQIAMYLLRNELKLSFPKIARELGRKDHTTAIHSIEKIHRESVTDENIKAALGDIKEKLYV